MQHSSSPSKQKSNEITYIRNKSHQPMVFLENACTETRMLEKRRQMFEISEALEHQKDEFARREDAFRRREDSLRKKDLQLQESLIKFNKFLQDNERKKTRAIKRTADENRNTELKSVESNKKFEKLQEKASNEKVCKDELVKNGKYRTYLSNFVDFMQGTSDEFSEIQDILNRHRTLTETNSQLIEQQKKSVTESELRRAELFQLSRDKVNSILNRNNEIASLQKNLETVTLSTVGMQSMADATYQDVNVKVSELGQVHASVENLFLRLENQAQRYKKKKPVEPLGTTTTSPSTPSGDNDHGKSSISSTINSRKTLEYLETIADYITDYQSITEEW
eukprot:CAMPEP_0194371220 /NCGR_PEP_ID=MMETSP0174-20130528/19604_1 /TAXON_ID=216777 /ORGANISM="Proboscia alata, Strain PI-D3" /LENGTH=336 /DNA_ID=CAMNT_0039149145 /DNA_START=177 /DNA_END=1184 /DNA_ORIENTATION=-